MAGKKPTHELVEELMADPLAEFILGVAEIFFADEQPNPATLKPRVDALLAQRPAPPLPLGKTSRQAAEALVEAAWETEDGSGAILAIDALRTWPNCAHAYVYLATDAGDEMELALALFTLGITAGFEALGETYFEQNRGGFWQLVETRPFMRALEGAGHAYWLLGATEPAAAHFTELLGLNPNDNQGARYGLLGCYLEMQEPEGVEALLEAFTADSTPLWAYGKALAAFQSGGDSAQARAALVAAVERAPLVARYLLDPDSIPDSDPDELEPFDDPTTAARWLAPGWETTPGATDWLRSQTGGVPAPRAASKEKRSGPRQV